MGKKKTLGTGYRFKKKKSQVKVSFRYEVVQCLCLCNLCIFGKSELVEVH